MAKSKTTATAPKPTPKPTKAKDEPVDTIATNRKAYHDYHVLQTWEAGIILQGSEVKSLRLGHCQMISSYAKVDPFENRAWLLSLQIPEYKGAGPLFQHAPQRQRELLLHKREVDQIRTALNERGTTLVPLKMYFKKGKAKVQIGLCRGKRAHDKREVLKKRDDQRKIDRIARR